MVRTWMVGAGQFRGPGGIELQHVQIFENRGAMMGASNPHPHCQIWATASLPEVDRARNFAAQHAYRRTNNRCLLCDYIAVERREDSVHWFENDGFVTVVPFWAVWPFEIMFCSRRHMGSMNDFDA